MTLIYNLKTIECENDVYNSNLLNHGVCYG